VSTSRRLAASVLLVVLALVSAACSGGNDVGDEKLLNFDQEQAERLGATSAPPSTATADTAVAATTPGGVATTPRATTTLPPEKQAVTLEVGISEGSPYFDPEVVQVLAGSKVRFTNHGTGVHSVVSDTGAFDSGDLAPGAVWIFHATTPGRFNYSDGHRPFAVGVIEVVR
jgi:plastocyanin